MRERHHCVDRILLLDVLKGGRAQVIHKEYTTAGKLTCVPTYMSGEGGKGGQLGDSGIIKDN